ncbi:MAG: hypothetical protein E7541_03150 [Ruminococcaceae bacterium]|nr:hypothetical protein [Oscillospiraceae bacterium]
MLRKEGLLIMFDIPKITFFVNGNPYCGSSGGFNFRITPVKSDAEKGVDAHIEVFTWYGMLSSELSPRQSEASFPLDTDGLKAVNDWLVEQELAYRDAQ